MLILLIFILIILLLNPQISSICVLETSKAWLFNLVPILYPNFIIIDLLISNNSLSALSYYLYPLFKKTFKIRYPKSSLIIILSIICGCPSSTKMISYALENKEIDEKEANSLLYSTSTLSLSYTIFILNAFNINILFYYIILLLIIIFIMRLTNKGNATSNTSFEKANNSFLKSFIMSINKNIDILLSILGIMIFFNILLTLFDINDYIYSYFESLNGHNKLLSLSIKKELKDMILLSSLSFLGLSVHLQILYVYPNLNYIKFIMYRLFSSFCLCGSFVLLFAFT